MLPHIIPVQVEGRPAADETILHGYDFRARRCRFILFRERLTAGSLMAEETVLHGYDFRAAAVGS